jgi:AraC-like DNA-binding protein
VSIVYRERPSAAGAVVWTSVVQPGQRRILPDGCMDLIWDGDEVMIAGPDTEAFLYEGRPGTTLTGLRFAPGAAPTVIRAPADEFLNARVPLGAVWSRADVTKLYDQLHEAERIGAVLDALARRADPDLLTRAVAAAAERGDTVATIAGDAGMSARQLQRRCRVAFGYGAKTLTRILRMGRALDLARVGTDFARAAADTGYADQAPFTREVKELTGVAPRQLVGRSEPRST